jgi:hypothetical protein
MAKYSDYDGKRPRDYWPTVDPAAVEPLIPFVKGKTYAEPCFGSGDLYERFREQDTSIVCRWMSDIEPQVSHMTEIDALSLVGSQLTHCDLIITNPPYTWAILKPLMDHFISLKSTWLLLPADYMHNKRFGPYMKCCSDVVSVGRLYWMKDKPVRGKENYAWYRFNRDFEECETIFHGR